MEAERSGTGPVWVSEALRALGAALEGSRAPPTAWFKESSQKNLRSRDFLAPRGALQKSFPDGEVPEELLQKLMSINVSGVPPIKREQVHLVPAGHSEEVAAFLYQLGVSWPRTEEADILEKTISGYEDYLKGKVLTSHTSVDPGQPAEEFFYQRVLFSVPLKSYTEEQNLCLQGYDPNLDTFQVTTVDLEHVARLQGSVQERVKTASPSTVLHVVSCAEEFHQQKLNLLWRLLDPGATAVTQKLLICGPVKVLHFPSPISGPQYYHLRKSQMREASVMKYGESVQGDSWDGIITCLTSAAVRFELMATPHRSQVTVDIEDSNITTKGTKSGAFVMYNCARLATMFNSYDSAVHQGLYPGFPPAEEINYSSLSEEGEWLLLFNYIMMFPEVLSQSAEISLTSPGIRVTANTEAVCKFLVGLSMDFSCYYNRVHILGEPLPHLFGQMFARLHLMKAVRSVLRSALDTLHILPLTQI
ncbi:DALR anticodon-binding domain-containing protein 3 isoform X2 [Pseudophryne corroboree]|uniref:DALR anticodon-binding domain-containing protein 3 isoform X2 n=1 Tax=Pseudophryne corroboree TaxID=495146 RepID=UPI003081B897